MAAQRTLSIIKPDVSEKGVSGEIIAMLEKGGLKMVAIKRLRLTSIQAKAFYEVHKDKPFYGELVEFMTSGPVVVSVWEGDDAVNRNRAIMGPTDSTKAPKDTIRGSFGADIQNNAVHGSDSPENARKEINFFFGDYELM